MRRALYLVGLLAIVLTAAWTGFTMGQAQTIPYSRCDQTQQCSAFGWVLLPNGTWCYLTQGNYKICRLSNWNWTCTPGSGQVESCLGRTPAPGSGNECVDYRADCTETPP